MEVFAAVRLAVGFTQVITDGKQLSNTKLVQESLLIS